MALQIKQISWRDAFGSPYRFALHPAMLTDKGYTIKAVTFLKGQSKLNGKIPVEIITDRDYVIEYLSQVIFKKLFFEDYDTFLELMHEAWNFYEDHK